jgi:hypothetical protein
VISVALAPIIRIKFFATFRVSEFSATKSGASFMQKKKNALPSRKQRARATCGRGLRSTLIRNSFPAGFIGQRDAGCAYHFMHDLRERLANRVQLTTDGHRAYLTAVEDSFGCEVDYAMLAKIYGNAPEGPEVRYSPAVCMGARKAVVSGNPDFAHVSTSYVERQNLTMRMSMRRFTRLTNGHSKKLENHEHAVAIHYMYYNFARIHQSLRVTPAMEAGISDHVYGQSKKLLVF